ncbi:hypothetical protein FCM35_KLT19062 [Carex littledalei]|uniref:Uncharacterized protein n=1 Tax=Carex littledalei TaxID=544730 RepID=A0A833VF41_9POAL|nr:hypothetical protein FCM35_KLT19062 [Carex littledalei]
MLLLKGAELEVSGTQLPRVLPWLFFLSAILARFLWRVVIIWRSSKEPQRGCVQRVLELQEDYSGQARIFGCPVVNLGAGFLSTSHRSSPLFTDEIISMSKKRKFCQRGSAAQSSIFQSGGPPPKGSKARQFTNSKSKSALRRALLVCTTGPETYICDVTNLTNLTIK